MWLVVLLLFWAVAADKPRLGICVTGQLRRLELMSKIHHLIKPNMDEYDIDVQFVLASGPLSSRTYSRQYGQFENGKDINSVVLEHCPNCSTAVDISTPPKFPQMPKPYFEDLSKLTGVDISILRRRGIARSQLFHSWSKCFQGFSSNPNVQYHAFARLRGDLFVTRPMVVAKSMWKGVVSIADGCGSPGYNDKMGILDAQFGFQYFVGPLSNMYLRFEETRLRVYSATVEAIVRVSLRFDRVPVQILNAKRFPLMPTKRIDAQSLCLLYDSPKYGSATGCAANSLHKTLVKYQCTQNNNVQDTDRFWRAQLLGEELK